ncbi:AbiTii domain-containing protein [Aurantivibrio plasticivorans]
MQLIDQILEILSKESPSLEDALIKTKVLLHKLGEKESIDWVNKEINGYEPEDEVPSYRVVSCEPRVTATDGYRVRLNDSPAVTKHLSEELIDYLTKVEMRESISGIHHLAFGEGDALTRPIPPEFWRRLAEGYNDLEVVFAHCQIAKSQILRIHTFIRSRLLDFILELSEKIPKDAKEEDVLADSGNFKAGHMLKNAIFGDNATIIIGHGNQQQVSNSIGKNDFEALAESLQEHGVEWHELNELKNV